MSTTTTAMEQRAPKKYGTREQVFAGTALQTKGGLTKDDLFESKGKYVSKRASDAVKERLPLMRNKAAAAKTVVPDSESEHEVTEKPSLPKVQKAVKKIEDKIANVAEVKTTKPRVRKQKVEEQEVIEPQPVAPPPEEVKKERKKKVVVPDDDE